MSSYNVWGIVFLSQNLNSNSPQDDDFDSTIASLPDNMAKNRFKVHLPGT